MERYADRSRASTPDTDVGTRISDSTLRACGHECVSACEDDTIFDQPARWDDADHVVLGPSLVSRRMSEGLLYYFHVEPSKHEMRVTLPDCSSDECPPRCVEAVTTTR